MNSTILRCSNVRKTFVQNKIEVNVLKGVDLDVKKGEMLSLIHILTSLCFPVSCLKKTTL